MSGESLTFKIGADTSNFKRGINEATKDLNKIKATAGGVSETLGKLGVGLSIAAVGSYMAGVVKEFARVKDLADRFRESSTSIQRVGQASRQAGSDIELVAKAMAKMTVEAQKGGDIAELMGTLGINTREFLSLDLEGKLVTLADAYAKTSGNVEKTAMFMELLGGRGQDLLPLLEQGGDALRRTFEATKVASEEAVKAAADLDDRWTAAMDNMKVKTLEFLNIAGAIPKFLGSLGGSGLNPNSDAAFRKAAEAKVDAELERTGGNKLGPNYQSRRRLIDEEMQRMVAEEANRTPVVDPRKKEAPASTQTIGKNDRQLGPGNDNGYREWFAETQKQSEKLNQAIERNKELRLELMPPTEKLAKLEEERVRLENTFSEDATETWEIINKTREVEKDIRDTKEQIANETKRAADEEKRAADEAERNAEALAAQNREIQERKTANLETLATRGPGRFSGTQAAARRALAMQEEAQDRFARGDVIGGRELIDKANQTSVKLAENIAARSVTDNQVREEARRRAREGDPMSEQAVREELRREASQRAKDALNGTLDKSAESKQADREAKESKERQTSADPQKNSLESIVKNILQEIKDRLPQHALT